MLYVNADDQTGTIARLRNAVAQRPIASVMAAFAVALLAGSAVAIPIVASKSSDVSDLESELEDTADELADTEAERDEAQATAEAVVSRKDEILGGAKAKAAQLVADAESERNKLNDEIKSAEGDLSSTQSKLDEVNASLNQAQETKEMSTFSDGTWSVGQDVLAGTYRSTAGGNCYWEILNSPSSGSIDNIVDNGFGPNAVISISTGQYVHVSDCGTWNPGP